MCYASRYFKCTLYLGSVPDLIKILNEVNIEVVRLFVASKYTSTKFAISIKILT